MDTAPGVLVAPVTHPAPFDLVAAATGTAGRGGTAADHRR
jgi:hypothetical protein